MRDPLASAVRRVVRNDNCSGCGGCSLISPRVAIALDESGHLRPTVDVVDGATSGVDVEAEADLFKSVCPGVSVQAPTGEFGHDHPIFGPYESAWSGWAIDPSIRHAGSSGGVLTALSGWLIETGRVDGAIGSKGSETDPARTVPVAITSREDAFEAAGSRYAPVSNVSEISSDNYPAAVVGKPCEVSALSSYWRSARPGDEVPIRLTFFCAGTPGQNATVQLSEHLGVRGDEIAGVRYRGNGWPGEFIVTAVDGRSVRTSYDESWGRYLGRELPWRCKICVDGTGAHADISVGDFWFADENGYPLFDSADGVSVVIARTQRGHDILLAAVADNVLHLKALDLDEVAAVQPLQVDRKTTLVGRLAGRLLSGRSIPRYQGFSLVRAARLRPFLCIRSGVGTWLRSVRRP